MKVTCYAAGVIGAGWATNFALKGCDVAVYDLKEEFLDKAKGMIENNLMYLAENGCFDEKETEGILGRISYTTSVKEAVKDAYFIQESGPEKLELKQAIVNAIEEYAPADCIIASSTSGLNISDITAKTTHPERFVGAHPFNPPHLIPLIEMTKSPAVSEDTLNRAIAFYRSMGKEPIVLKKEKKGFVANRLSHAVLREVMSLVNEGVCTAEEADKALVYGPGLRWASMGQIMIGELGSQGGNIEAAVRFKSLNESIFQDLENRTEIPENWGKISSEGAKDLMEHFPDEIGHTREDAAAFRDKVLIEVLKLHGKL